MTEPAYEKLTAAGWTLVETSGFLNLVGPLWQRIVDGNHEYAILAEHKHHNRRNRVQGGVLMTLAAKDQSQYIKSQARTMLAQLPEID